MGLNIMMAACMYPVILLIYYFMRKASNNKDNLIFGVRGTKEWISKKEVADSIEDIRKEYKKQVDMWTLIIALIPIVCFFIKYISIQVMIWCLLLFVDIFVVSVPFARANLKMRRLKENTGNFKNKVVYVELKTITPTIRKQPYIAWGIISALTAIVPLVYELGGVNVEEPAIKIVHWVVFASYLFMILVSYWLEKMVMLGKRGVISENTDVNINYNRAKQHIWHIFGQAFAGFTTIFLIVIALSYGSEKLYMYVMISGVIIHTLAVMILAVWASLKQNALNDAYANKRELESYIEDEDDKWIFGMLYYNPDDSRTLVENRMGTGTTTNMAKPIGKILDAIAVVSVVLTIVLCIWLVFEEFTPIELKINDNGIEAIQNKVEYQIELQDIERAELIEELPRRSKSVGTAIEELEKGTFYVREKKAKCEFFLNPQNSCFIYLETKDGIYYLSGENDEQTKEVYSQIN